MGKEYDYSLLKSCGEDVYISDKVEIKRPHLVSVGSHVAIDSGFYITCGAEIGDWIHIGPYVTVIGGPKTKLVMEGFNTVSAGGRLVCASDEFLGEGIVGISPPQYRDNVRYDPIVFEKFASIGTNAVVHPGVRLAQGSVAGSCSLTTKDTRPWTIYMDVKTKKVMIPRRRDKMLSAAREMGYDVGGSDGEE